MPKSPLFSTYRQGENRVTASLMAVFERIDLTNLERILASASEDSALQLFSFENQVHGGSSPSVPDARISASFALWFETKTAPGQVRIDQLRGHLKHLGDGHGYERLFLLTPDADEPEAVATIDDARLKWLSFKALSQAIDDLLGDDRELVSEKEELLLRELQALFEVDNLLGDPRGVVVVPAGRAHREYLDPRPTSASRVGPSSPSSGWPSTAADGSSARSRACGTSSTRSSSPGPTLNAAVVRDPLDAEVADLIERALDERRKSEGTLSKVFLLSGPDDPETERLEAPIANDATDANGRTTAWVMMQRYASLSGAAVRAQDVGPRRTCVGDRAEVARSPSPTGCPNRSRPRRAGRPTL